MKHRLYTLILSALLFSAVPSTVYAVAYDYGTPTTAPEERTGNGWITYRQLGGSNSTRYLITASPADGWEFTQWNDASTANPRVLDISSITYTSDKSVFTATFSRKSAPTVTIAPVPAACYGSVSCSLVASDDDCLYKYELRATAEEGYQFAFWSDGNTDNPRTVKLPGRTLYERYAARFYKVNSCSYSKVVSEAEIGKVTLSKGADGCHWTLTAEPEEGYSFVKWSDDNINATRAIELSDNEITYKAYFQGVPADDIVWQGGTSGEESDWDTYSNWKIWKSGETQYTVGNAPELKNYNPLSNSLRVIIPEVNSTVYPVPGGGVANYPEIPDAIDDCGGVHTADGSKFADNIYIEYGGALRGVENLTGDESAKLYGSATTEFVADRKEWILVGTVVKPFDTETLAEDDVRDVVSGDFYLDFTPNVYMREARISDEVISWDKAFPNLDESVPAQKVFVIQIPDAYGTSHLPATLYNLIHGTSFDEDASIKYTFNGRFYNDAALTTYTELNVGAANLLCNTYPSNLDPTAVEGGTGGTVQIYQNGEGGVVGSFVVPVENSRIKPQQGFVFTPASESTLTITSEMIADGGTKYKSALYEKPSCFVQVVNKDTQANEGSYVALFYDELADPANADLRMDAPKLFVTTATVPELYIDRFGKPWAGLNVSDTDEPVSLGLKLRKAMNIEFSLKSINGYTKAILSDIESGAEYDLMSGEPAMLSLAAGDYTGRFFLNVTFDDTQEQGGDVPTDVSEQSSCHAITLYSDGRDVNVVALGGEELTNALVSSVSGKSIKYDITGVNAKISLPETAGVYIVRVSGTTLTKVVKFVVK